MLSIYTDTLITQSAQSSWRGINDIADHPDTTFADFLDERSSEEEPFDEDDMYGLDQAMLVVSESSDDGGELEPDVHILKHFMFIFNSTITG